MEKISIYQVRSFGEKLNATFDFFKQHWKVFFRFSLYVLLPLSLLQAVGADEYYSTVFAEAASGADSADSTASIVQQGAMIGIIMLVSVFATAFVYSLAYGLMKTCQEGVSLDGLTFKAFWKQVQGRCFKRTFLMMLFGFLVVVLAGTVVGLLSSVSSYTLIVTIPAVVVFALPLTLWNPVYLIEEDTNLIDAFYKSYRYGLKTWGSLFVLILVMTLIVYLAYGLLQIPGMLMVALKTLAFPQLEGFGGIVYTFITFIVMTAGIFFSWMPMLPYLIAFGYHYGSAAEEIDNVTAADDIAHFDEMGDNNVDDPALETKRSDIDDFEQL